MICAYVFRELPPNVIFDVVFREVVESLLHSELDKFENVFVLLVVSQFQIFFGDLQNYLFVLVQTCLHSEVEFGFFLVFNILNDLL